MFLSWDGFINRFMQIFKNLRANLKRFSNKIYNIILNISNAD